MTIRRRLPGLLMMLAGLACQTALGAAGPNATAPYHGAFDCYGTEGGLGAYAGRVTLDADGTTTFRNYDDQTQTGSWSIDSQTGAISFAGAVDIGSAVYDASGDTLAVALAAGAQVVHAEGGAMACQRSEPGITGPP